MSHQTRPRTRLAALSSLLGIALCAAPAAQANHPDVLYAAAAAKVATRASPDAFERAVAAAPRRPLAPSPDVFERAVTKRVATSAPPDAFVRGVESLWPERIARQVIEGTVQAGGVANIPEPAATGGGFHWSDFGIGAAAGIGFVLVLGGLGVGLAAGRRDGRRVRSA